MFRTLQLCRILLSAGAGEGGGTDGDAALHCGESPVLLR